MDPELETNDQDTLTAEETAQLAEMEKDTGEGEAAPAVAAPAAEGGKGKKKKPAAATPETTEGTPEGTEGEGDEGKGGDGKQVPLAALHESRQQTKAIKDELAAQRAENAKLMDRFERTLKAFAPKEPVVEEPKPDPIPDFESDPAGWIAGTMKATGKQLADVEKELGTLRAEKAQTAETNKNLGVIKGVMDYAVNKEIEFKAVTPDYDAASAFLLKSRHDELEDMGYEEAQRNQIINTERLSIASQAQQLGKNPAEMVYNIAKRRGFAPKAPAGDKVAETTNEEKIAAATKGAEHATSLANGRGNLPPGLTVQRLLEMPEADFDRAVQTPEGRALMGS